MIKRIKKKIQTVYGNKKMPSLPIINQFFIQTYDNITNTPSGYPINQILTDDILISQIKFKPFFQIILPREYVKTDNKLECDLTAYIDDEKVFVSENEFKMLNPVYDNQAEESSYLVCNGSLEKKPMVIKDVGVNSSIVFKLKLATAMGVLLAEAVHLVNVRNTDNVHKISHVNPSLITNSRISYFAYRNADMASEFFPQEYNSSDLKRFTLCFGNLVQPEKEYQLRLTANGKALDTYTLKVSNDDVEKKSKVNGFLQVGKAYYLPYNLVELRFELPLEMVLAFSITKQMNIFKATLLEDNITIDEKTLLFLEK